MAVGDAEAQPSAGSQGWLQAREATPPRDVARMSLAVVALLVVVLAGLALFTSFTLEPLQGDPSPTPGGGEDGADDGQGDGGGSVCENVGDFFFGSFLFFLVVTLVLFGLGVVFRDRSPYGFGGSLWGILSIVSAVLTVLVFGAWRLMVALCDGQVDCENANNGSFTAFWVLLLATAVSIGVGIALSHLKRRNFFVTGWGLLGVLLYLPTILVGFTWFIVRTVCSEFLTCATRDEFLNQLGTVFFVALAVALVAAFIGWWVQQRYGHGMFKSGWAVLSILFLVLAATSGAGWLFVNDLTIPGCDPMEPQEEEEAQTCEEIKADLQQRLGAVFWTLAGLALVLFVLAFVLKRDKNANVFASIWAILGYIALGLAVLVGIFFLLAGTLCGDEGDYEDPDEGDQDGEPGDPGDGDGGDGGGGGDGGDGGGGGSGGSGGGGGSGDGGGGGSGPGIDGGGSQGPGDVSAPPLQLDPNSLKWVLIVLAGLAALVVLGVVLFRMRRTPGESGASGAPMVDPAQRKRLMQILAQGKLQSRDTVIAAYRGFLAFSDQEGLRIRPEETPREHARRVATKCAVPHEELTGLVGAYEVARLSDREPTLDERDQAIAVGKTFYDRTTGVGTS